MTNGSNLTNKAKISSNCRKLLVLAFVLGFALPTTNLSISGGQIDAEGTIDYSPKQGPAGTQVTISGSGFTWLEDLGVTELLVRWDIEWSGPVLARAPLEGGSFKCSLVVPESWGEVPGTHGILLVYYYGAPVQTGSIALDFYITGGLVTPQPTTAQPTESSLPTETPLPDLPPGSDAFVGVLAALSGLRDFLGGNIVVLGGVVFVTGGLAVFLRHFLRSRRSSFTSPVGLAGMFPENPDYGVMVTGDDEGFIEFIWRKIQEGGRMKVAEPENLPEMLKISEDEGFVDTVTKYFGKVLTDAERAAQDVANEIAGRFVRENPAWGSDSELQQKLAQDNNAELLRQVERELVADAGVAAVKAVRAMVKSKDFFNSEKNLPDDRFNIPPDIAPNDLVDRARKIGGGGDGAWEWISNRDWSGPVDSYYDWKLPDGHDIADAAGGTYAKNAAAHKAYRVFRQQYGRGPSPDNYADVDVWNKIRENIKSGEGE
jgi:hypothetical protein